MQWTSKCYFPIGTGDKYWKQNHASRTSSLKWNIAIAIYCYWLQETFFAVECQWMVVRSPLQPSPWQRKHWLLELCLERQVCSSQKCSPGSSPAHQGVSWAEQSALPEWLHQFQRKGGIVSLLPSEMALTKCFITVTLDVSAWLIGDHNSFLFLFLLLQTFLPVPCPVGTAYIFSSYVCLLHIWLNWNIYPIQPYLFLPSSPRNYRCVHISYL